MTDVADNAETERFEISVDGEVAGFVKYRLPRPGRIVFVHTEIDPAHEGKGLGSKLARAVLDSARERGLEVVPMCPFIKGYIDRHPEYADLVA
ncbi:N-acetyltransferase [Herbidospora galbida]|uniref:N-acetyltransferase n=1 Tax=Herbidospora galbida TaxID=2575442 RepID=A0A4U3MGB3_9ACTN|nr:GNAT family N-acetyltransferase [Herbidospora galbida]TKK88221.1 N-acetyltransferase [Herbidospora galbida]